MKWEKNIENIFRKSTNYYANVEFNQVGKTVYKWICSLSVSSKFNIFVYSSTKKMEDHIINKIYKRNN